MCEQHKLTWFYFKGTTHAITVSPSWCLETSSWNSRITTAWLSCTAGNLASAGITYGVTCLPTRAPQLHTVGRWLCSCCMWASLSRWSWCEQAVRTWHGAETHAVVHSQLIHSTPQDSDETKHTWNRVKYTSVHKTVHRVLVASAKWHINLHFLLITDTLVVELFTCLCSQDSASLHLLSFYLYITHLCHCV